jgi:hypothetical protein
MKAEDIRKMQAQQTEKMGRLRCLISEKANSGDYDSALILAELNSGFWLSEIALQLALLSEGKYDGDGRSVWERLFGQS